MEAAETKNKNTSKAIPITLFVMFVVTALFSPGAAGFFLFASFISFLICRMQDNLPEPGAGSEYNLTDWHLPEEDTGLFTGVCSFGGGASPLAGVDHAMVIGTGIGTYMGEDD